MAAIVSTKAKRNGSCHHSLIADDSGDGHLNSRCRQGFRQGQSEPMGVQKRTRESPHGVLSMFIVSVFLWDFVYRTGSHMAGSRVLLCHPKKTDITADS